MNNCSNKDGLKRKSTSGEVSNNHRQQTSLPSTNRPCHFLLTNLQRRLPRLSPPSPLPEQSLVRSPGFLQVSHRTKLNSSSSFSCWWSPRSRSIPRSRFVALSLYASLAVARSPGACSYKKGKNISKGSTCKTNMHKTKGTRERKMER